MRVLSYLRKSRRGAITVWAAICITMVMGFVAFALDLGYMVLTDSELQNAADAAALSAAQAYSNGTNASIAAAQLWASRNTAAGTPVAVSSSDVVFGKWDGTKASFTVLPSNSTSINAVKVTCQRSTARGNALKLFFAPVIGTKTSSLSRSAIAQVTTSRCGLIIGIPSVTMSGSSYTDSYDASKGPYSAASAGMEGHVCSNGNITMSGSAAIHGNAQPGVSGIVKSSSSIGVLGKISNLSKPLSYPPVDPGNAATVNNNSKIPLSANNKQPLDSSGKFTLSGGDSVTLAPGTYYFNQLALSGGSMININGPTTIYVNGKVDLSGGSVANKTLLPANLQLFCMGATANISGGSDFYGVVYGPSCAMTRSSSASFFGAIIGAQLTMSGSGGIHADVSLNTTLLGGNATTSMLVK
jgi:Flp pilus assembly protein TadG